MPEADDGGMTRPMTLLPILAVASLVVTGLFLIAIFSPPLFNMIFGEEYAWYEWGVIYGIVHVAAAVALVTLRSRLGLGAGLILASINFTSLSGYLLSRIPGPGGFTYVDPVELVIVSIVTALQATIVVGVLDAARRWDQLPGTDLGRSLSAAILGGIGFAIGLAFWGGDYGIMVSPIEMPVYETIAVWLSLPHFVALAALAFGGRLVVPVAVAISLGGTLLGAANVFVLATWDVSPWSLVDSIALWGLLTVGYAAAAIILLRPPATNVPGRSAEPADL